MRGPWTIKIHFNRINMQRGNPCVWTICFRGRCIQVESITTKVVLCTDYKPKGRQPRAVIKGKAFHVILSDDEKRAIVC